MGMPALLVGLVVALGAAAHRPAPDPIRWRTDEAAALDESRRSGRPVLLDAWADWCAGCRLLDRNTWSDPAVREEVQAHFVPLRLDVSTERSAAEVRVRSLDVSALPAVLICSSRGCDGAPRLVGYVGAAEMLAFLRQERARLPGL
jgi:thiol:disulfide interchange protein DsbD